MTPNQSDAKPLSPLADHIVDYQTTSIMLLDCALAVQYLNPAAEALVGRSDGQTSGFKLRELFVGIEPIIQKLQHALQDGQIFTERQRNLELADHTQIVVDYTATPMPGGRGLLLELQPLDRLLRINRDDQLNRQRETTRKLTRGLAHEVKNPLGGIRGAAQLLDKELEDDALKEYTQVIIEEVDRLRDLVDRMLGPSQAPRFGATNVHRILERVVQLVEVETRPTLDVTFERDYDPSLPRFEGDADQIMQAVLNIVRNAIDALHATRNPKITLQTRIARQFNINGQRHRIALNLEITDNGPGVDPNIIDRIFFPMISGRAEGSGLGLAIAQSIVAQHNGVLACDSQPGQTIFSIHLPLAQPKTIDAGSQHPLASAQPEENP